MSAEEILAQIEQFETAFDTFNQKTQANIKEFSEKLASIWKNVKSLKGENMKLEETIKTQEADLMAIRTESESLDKNIQELKSTKDELTTKCTELSTELERLNSNQKEPEFQLTNLTTKLSEVNERITSRESEKTTLDQKKVENSQREEQKKKEYQQKLEEVEKRIKTLKDQNFFTSFVIENSDQDIFEVDILATILEKGKCNLNEIKKQLDVTPIMAVRTIKQLAVKDIIKLDEDTNEISMP
jgi:chromosome segregation ATPase